MVLARPLRLILLVLLLAALVLPRASAQDGGAEQSRLQDFLEGMLSTPERQVRIGEISGLLSSTVTIDSIEVADPQGAWLELEDIELTWNRLALFRGRLEIDRLRAERIRWLRTAADDAEAEGGAPSLPLSLDIQSIEAPVIEIAEPVAGRPATLAARGSLSALGESVEATIEVDRLDEPGGRLAGEFAFDPAQNVLRADASLSEPPGGLVAAFLNLPGRPAIELTLDGEGPLDDWRADLALAANGEPVLSGNARIARTGDGYRAVAEVAGQLGRIAPLQYQALLAGEARLSLNAVRRDDGTIRLDRAEVAAQHVDLEAEGVLAPDFVPREGRLDLRLSPAPGEPMALPFLPGSPEVQSAAVEAALGRGGGGEWSVTATVGELDHELGQAERLILEASGTAENLAVPTARRLAFRARAEARGVAPADDALAAALGERLALEAQGEWQAGEPVRLAAMSLRAETLSLAFSGSASPERIEGRYHLEADALSRLAPILEREIAGAVALDATGTIRPGAQGFELTVDGTARGLETGIAGLDPLLAGTVALRGGTARTAEGGFRLEDLTLSSEAVTARVTGSLAEPALDLSFEADVADLSRLSDRASGAARLAGALSGSAEAPRVAVTAEGEDVVLMGQRLADASARFEGVVAGPDTAGSAALSGRLDGVPVEGTAELSGLPGGGRRLERLRLSAGDNVAEGALTIRSDGLLEGRLSVRAPDIAVVAPLFLAEASGAAELDIRLEADGGQAARIVGEIDEVQYDEIAVGSADIDLTATNLFTAPVIEGRFAARELSAGGIAVGALEGTARRTGERTEFDVLASLAEGEAALEGHLSPIAGGFAVALESLRLSREGEELRLTEPATVAVRDGTAVLDRLTLAIDGGRAVVSGRAGAALDLHVEIAEVSASIANAVAPELEAQGTISGTVAVTGTPAAPRAAFDVAWRGASVRAAREAGLGPFDATAEGEYTDGALELTADLRSEAGLSLNVAGTATLTGAGSLDFRVTGEAPLALASRQLEGRGTRLTGSLAIDVSVGGTPADPAFSGRLTTTEAALVDPETGIVLRDLTLSARFTGDELVVERLTATSGPGGTVNGSGSVGLDPAAGFPLDLRLAVRDGRYVDGRLVAATLDADLTVTGPAARPTIGGTVTVERAEIAVPERLPRDHVAVEVRHVAPPPAVEATLRRARPRERPAEAGGEPAGVTLDVVIDAPARIFVRGRGLDAELGGRLALTGPVSAIAAAGAFELRRGHIDVLTQRITFDRGNVDFAGDLDPILDFEGTTRSGDITVTVTVTGRASDPAIEFSSVPELPQDEVLAHLLFRRSLSDLSPLQLARLAAAAAELGGLTEGPGLLERLRAATGLDVLDVVPAEDGGLAVEAGRYINENIYLGLEQGATAESSRVTIELDITRELKARGEVRGDGASSVGIFYEREY